MPTSPRPVPTEKRIHPNSALGGMTSFLAIAPPPRITAKQCHARIDRSLWRRSLVKGLYWSLALVEAGLLWSLALVEAGLLWSLAFVEAGLRPAWPGPPPTLYRFSH